eukprot:gene18127-19937_t
MRELYSYNQLCNSAVNLSPVAGASSESSSPRSSTTEDDLLEIHRASDQTHCNTSKPIYNFSIPDFIKHERQPATTVAANAITQDSSVIMSSSRPRAAKRRYDYREAGDSEPGDRYNTLDSASNSRRQKRRRTHQQIATQSPQLIDLTETDHEDTDTVGVVDEIIRNPYFDSTLAGVNDNIRDLNTSHNSSTSATAAVSFHSVTENLQHFRRRLRESRDRINQIRREVTARESRLRGLFSDRGSSRHHYHTEHSSDTNVVTDGLAYSPSNDAINFIDHDPTDNTLGYPSAPTSIINIDDDNIETSAPNMDRDPATRMLGNPLFSATAFTTPLDIQQQQTSPGRAIAAALEENARLHLQERVNEARSSRAPRDEDRYEAGNLRYAPSMSNSTQQDIGQSSSEDEVQFLRELRPPNVPTSRAPTASHADFDSNNQPNYNWGHLSRARRRFSGLFSNSNMNVPDFLFPYVHLFNHATAPRLRHFPANSTDQIEDYEALWNLAERLGPAKPKGLSKSEIDKIHAFRYTASCQEETNPTCVVCMSEYCLREKIRKLPCTHDFHSKCIDKWLRSNKTCPVCRDEIKCI